MFGIKIIVIAFIVAITSISRLSAQNTPVHADVENLQSKKYLLKKDILRIDSLLLLIEENYGIENDDYFKLGNIKVNNSFMTKYDSLLPLLKNLDVLYRKGFGDNKQYETYLRKKCHIYNYLDVNEDSIFDTYALLWDIHKKNLAKTDTVDFKLFDEYCVKCMLKKRNNLLESLRLEALYLNKSVYTDKSPQYENALKNLILFYNYKSLDNMNEDEKKKLFLQSSKYYKEWLTLKDLHHHIKDDEYKQIFTSYTSGLLYLCNDSLEAKNLLEEYSNAIKEVYGEESEQYYEALDAEKNCYPQEEQIPILQKMLSIAESLWGKDSYQYQLNLNIVSATMLSTGNIREAVNLNESFDADTFINNILDSLSLSDKEKSEMANNMELSEMGTKSVLNSMYGNWDVANANLKKVMYHLIDDLNIPFSQMNFYSSYQSIINNYIAQNEKDSIVALGQEFIPLISNDSIAMQLLMSINYACKQGEALDFTDKIMAERASFLQCSEYPALLECVAEIKGVNRNIDDALKFIEKAFGVRENTAINQIRKLIYEEILLAINENYIEAFDRNQKALRLITQLPDYKESIEYAGLLMRSCLEGIRVGQYELVKENGEYVQSLNYPNVNLHSYFNYNFSQAGSVFFILQNPLKEYVTIPLIEAYINMHLNEKALSLLIDYANSTRELIISALSLVGPATNRIVDIQQISSTAQSTLSKSAVKLNNDSVNELAYDNALLTKQLLLNASERMKKLIMESGDENIVEKYNELVNTQTLIDNAAYSGLSVDSLYKRKKTIEVQLNADSKLFGDYTKELNCSWKDIQKVLKEGECAIEFVQYTDNDINNYVALVLLPNNGPIPIYICTDKDIESIKDPYNNVTATELIWKPIISKIQNIKKIYFSPAGNLHLLGIENFILNDGSLISDKYGLYRVSSTRILIEPDSHKALNSGVLYGGLTFDENIQTMIEDSKKYSGNSASDSNRSYNIGDSLNLRSGVSYLPSTKLEIDEINRLLGVSNVHTVMLQGEQGTESSFKSFSGQKIDFIHIATHGFYWNKKESEANSRLGFMASFVGDKIDKEDKAMSRSGLLFSGANNALMSKSIPNSIDDGILTAKEISSLDLSSVELVVLSACQTGLGEISSDGVLGLQRGFKKAGAHTLLMSLWKVDDKATQMLMTHFYDNLTKGKSKLESLKEAQHYIREYEVEKEIQRNNRLRPLSAQAREQAQKDNLNKIVEKVRPYKHPKYWAAFILLDAIQ